MKKKILFTGGSGLLAVNWALSISNDFEVLLGMHKRTITVPGIPCIPLHMEDTYTLQTTLEMIRPDVVIHCAGLANVEQCEANPELAYHINVRLSENTAECCKALGIRFVYISTDHLFSGHQAMMTEEASVAPVNVYAKTKAQAEISILTTSENTLAIRTNFYGWGPSYRQSFSDMVIDKLRAEQEICLFTDFYHTPILIEELACVVMALLAKNAHGIFHVTGKERISKFDFGMRIAKQFGLYTSLIKPVKFLDRKDLTNRPVDLSLLNAKAALFLHQEFGSIDDNIRTLYEQEQNGFSKIMRSI